MTGAASELEEVRRVADAAEAEDGTAPLDEATWLALRSGRLRPVVRDGAVATLAGGELNLVAHPEARGRGLGGALLAEVLGSAGPGDLRAWSHADHPAARRLADRHGFERVRELWVMRRSGGEPLPSYDVPDDVVVRSYRDEDAEALLRVNAAAFAEHPEQGAMDEQNLAERMAEPWFDPAGLLVLEQDDRVVAFHWTKQHSPSLGEVYVVAVDPAVHGRGLGRVATLAGLEHLSRSGASEVLLYVESDNHPAVAVYDRAGFTHAPADTHVMYFRADPS